MKKPIFGFTGRCAIVFFLALCAPLYAATTPPTLAVGLAPEEERKVLEGQLAELEKQIDQYEDEISGYQKQGKTLKGEISSLNGKIDKLNLQIKAINLTLQELNRKISEAETQITITEKDLESKRNGLARLLQTLYEQSQTSILAVLLKNPQISDFVRSYTDLTLTQSNLRATIGQIMVLRDDLKDKHEQFSLAKADAESVRAYQASQKAQVDSTKKEKNQLLQVTKGQETRYQSLLVETKKTAAQIRSRIFQLLGGGELSFEEAYQYARLASQATGIRASLILAVLSKESALGQNVGRCTYKTSMSPQNKPIFLAIVAELNLNPDSLTVSCPNRDGAYGGAMGPAQFIPSTWNLFKGAIGKVTGHVPPSPWNNSDAFVATGLYLKDAMVGCATIYSSEASQDRCTAAKYYAGGRWKSYLWTYGESVVSKARGFQDDIDTITS